MRKPLTSVQKSFAGSPLYRGADLARETSQRNLRKNSECPQDFWYCSTIGLRQAGVRNTSSSEKGKRDESRHTSSIEPALDQSRGRSPGAMVVKTGIMGRGLLRSSRRLCHDHTEPCHGVSRKEAQRPPNGRNGTERNAWRPRTATGPCGPPREACAGRGAGTHRGREVCTVHLTLRDCSAASSAAPGSAVCYRS